MQRGMKGGMERDGKGEGGREQKGKRGWGNGREGST